MNIKQKAKALFEKFRKKHDPFPGPNLHYKFMLEYGKLRYKSNPDFDIEVYESAVWLHDIGRYTPEDKIGYSRKEREYHKRLGAKIFDSEFSEEIKDPSVKDKIRRCITEHSGRMGFLSLFKKRYVEVQVIREADRISFLHPEYTKLNIKTQGKKKAEEFLNRNYNELLAVEPCAFASALAEKWMNESKKILN